MKTYDDWMKAQQNAKYWENKEKELRTKICNKLLNGKSVGTHNIEKSGYKIKVVKKVTYSIDKDLLAIIWDDLSEQEQETIQYKPSLLLNKYKEIPDASDLNQAISVKPAMPTLSIEYVMKENMQKPN